MKKKFFKGLIEWTCYAIVFVLIILGTPKALVKIFKTDYPVASITSSSMWPTLKEGDLVLIKGFDSPWAVEIGEIVVFENERGFTIHRVIEKRDYTLVTKGDANSTIDLPIKYEQLIGRAVEINDKPIRIPWFGKISQIFRK